MADDEFVLVDGKDVPSTPELSPEFSETKGWLEPTVYLGESSELQQHLNWLVPGTGKWIEETPEFQQWQTSPSHGALWVKAIAGAGKSVLMARLVSILQQSTQKERTPVLFFFFRQIVAANHDSHALVRDWLTQLLSHSNGLIKTLKALRSRYQRVQDVAFNELWQVLLDTIVSLSKVYCVVDALDELDSAHAQAFLPRLLALGQLAPDRIKLGMSSRPLPHIQKVLNHSSVFQIRLENAHLNKDIAVFVDYRLRQTQSNLTEQSLAEIRNVIGNRVHPSFLYARLLLDEILERHAVNDWSEDSVRLSLASTPPSLEDLYTQMLLDHARKAAVPQNRQVLILQLVTHATRPLRLLETATVLDFYCKDMADVRDTKAMTRASCGPLLEIYDDETVSIIHHSFTEYLTDSLRSDRLAQSFPVLDTLATHHLIASICLQYLSTRGLSNYATDTTKRSPGVNDLQMKHPFTDYALKNWFVHARRLPQLDDSLLRQLDVFMSSENEDFRSWVSMVLGLEALETPTISPLHGAAWTGMDNYVEHLLTTGKDVHVTSKLQRAPITMAARNGHAAVVKTLLRYGAAPDEPDYYGMKPLHYAAQSNHHEVVQVLLDQGVSPTTRKTCDPTPQRCGNARSSIGDTPLLYACNAGAIESVQAMIPHFPLADAQRAIELLIGKSSHELLEQLTTFPGLDFASEFGGKCLHLAAQCANPTAVGLLLQLGCDPLYQPERPASCLMGKYSETAESALIALSRHERHFSARYRMDAVLKCLDLLLAVDYDLERRTCTGQTVLHLFIQNSLPGVEKLLQHGADVHATDNGGNTPLHLLRLGRDSEDILRALMRHGARWDVKRESDGKTPLHTSLKQSYSIDVNLNLLKPYISDWNIADAQGNTPLHYLLEHSSSAVAKLLKLGADLNRRNFAGLTALHLARRKSDVEELLSAGANLEVKDVKGRTVFLYHTIASPYYDWDYLIRKGANIHAVDFDGNGALALGLENISADRAWEFLLEAGVDAYHVNYNGDTLLHCLMECSLKSSSLRRPCRFFDILVHDKLLSPTAQNNQGRTILHLRCSVPLRLFGYSSLHENNMIEWLPKSEIRALLEIEDYSGRRAIHDAAATSEYLVVWLIEKGAVLTANTHTKQNALHIAALSKESNTIGLLLENIPGAAKHQVLNQQDNEGRTPLHYACSSGSLPSVLLLLEAGADATIPDNNKETPLHSCTHFKAHPHQPLNPQHTRRDMQTEETLGVHDIIQALKHAKVNILAKDSSRPSRTPLDLAVYLQNEEMVAALAEDTRKKMKASGVKETGPPAQLLLMARHKSQAWIIDDITAEDEGSMIGTCRHLLLNLRAYNAIREIAGRGWNLVTHGTHSHNCVDFLQDVVKCGLTSLFRDLGRMRDGNAWINGSPAEPGSSETMIDPYLIVAARREIPSVDLLRVMIEIFGANVNIQVYSRQQERDQVRLIASQTPLHVLAQGKHWWNTEGLRYLLQHGAIPDLRDEKGRSALHVAIAGGYRKVQIVKTLLEFGANPNMVDSDGNTPLGLAVGNTELVQLLLVKGADISLGQTPILYTAITMQDVDMVRTILDAGIDCNKAFIERNPVFAPSNISDKDSIQKALYGDYLYGRGFSNNKDADTILLCRPLHYACHSHFNFVTGRERAMEIIELLLSHQANPTLSIKTDDPDAIVIHEAIYCIGVIEPLLAHPGLDLEQRDGTGRTVFLAACSPRKQDPHQVPWATKTPGIMHSSPCTASRTDLIHRLVEMGADIRATDNKGDSAVHLLLFAIGKADHREKTSSDTWKSLITFLLDKDPSMLHRRNHAGYTPYHVAAECRLLNYLDLLQAHGANPLEPNPLGNTIVHYLAVSLQKDRQRKGGPSTFDFIKAYLAMGMDINARNNAGETPLFKYIAAATCEFKVRKYKSVIEQFQAEGAEIGTATNTGETILHFIARFPCTHDFLSSCSRRWSDDPTDKEEGVFKYFMGLGLDPFREDEEQRSAVDIAAAFGNEKILALFKKS
ncbi:ankyrin repeat-containing domain protein [Aspergillus stella-maris]|uniref:ankyrin repeat-containing domain protein n=1 Tax=Aspergillus stella-maris TaxID=1810926 RepID=UPI003CCCACBF